MKAKTFLKYWLPVIVYAAVIFILSSIPVPPKPPLFPHFDKLCHFLEYALLGFLLLRALGSTKANPVRNTGLKGDSKISNGVNLANLRTIAVLLAIIYGISDELHQHFVPGRFMELGDIMSDGLGAYAGQLFFKIKG